MKYNYLSIGGVIESFVMKPGDSGEWKTFMRSLKEKAIPIPLIKEVIDKSVGE